MSNHPTSLNKECEEILRKLIAKHEFLQLNNKNFDVWSHQDAAEVVADLIIMINQSEEIESAHKLYDWGK